MRPRTVLSMEQALSMTYATLRFAQLGWRVIRLEATPTGRGLPGDPNRYIGGVVADDDRRSYFVAPNVGKEAIALNLKEAEGRDALKRIIRELDVDVFCCNTLPSRYESLGIDYQTLREVKPDIIWAGISAMGPDYPDVPGYDPAIQAMMGFMEITGEASGPPMLSGVPLVDLKAGDEVYANVCLALAEKAETGEGREINVSMAQAAASWLITTLPLLDFDCDPSEIGRCGNEHRKFIPVNAYPTADGYLFLAVGNDRQWQRLTGIHGFEGIASERRETNAGRHVDRVDIHRDVAVATAGYTTSALQEALLAAGVPHAPINTIRQVRDMEAVSSKLITTQLPNGRTVHLSPPAVDREGSPKDYTFPPRYSEHTHAVLKEAGMTDDQVTDMAARHVIP